MAALTVMSKLSLDLLIVQGGLEKFNQFKKTLSIFNISFFLIMLPICNLFYLRLRWTFTFMLTMVVYLLFVYLDWFYLMSVYYSFRRDHLIGYGEINYAPAIGLGLALVGIFIVSSNLIFWALRAKRNKEQS